MSLKNYRAKINATKAELRVLLPVGTPRRMSSAPPSPRSKLGSTPRRPS